MGNHGDSWMTAERTYFTSESVTEGHPDKVCDQISDAVLDAVLRLDPEAHVACETATTTGMILVFGEISTTSYVDIPAVVRDTIEKIGYTHSTHGFDANTCGVMVAIKDQSPEILSGVAHAVEVRSGDQIDRFDRVGAGDQGMMIGFACNETPELMPLPISLAHGLCRRLATARKSGEIPWLLPDGKSQVTVEYHRGKPARVDTVVVSTQHLPGRFQRGDHERTIIESVVRQVIPDDAARRRDVVPHQSQRSIRDRRADGRCRTDGTQDHRRYLRWHGSPRRGSVFGEGRDKGRSLRGLCRALRREERCRGWSRRPLRGAGLIRDWQSSPCLIHDRDLRYRPGAG